MEMSSAFLTRKHFGQIYGNTLTRKLLNTPINSPTKKIIWGGGPEKKREGEVLNQIYAWNSPDVAVRVSKNMCREWGIPVRKYVLEVGEKKKLEGEAAKNKDIGGGLRNFAFCPPQDLKWIMEWTSGKVLLAILFDYISMESFCAVT